MATTLVALLLLIPSLARARGGQVERGATKVSEDPPSALPLHLLLKPLGDCTRPDPDTILVCGRDRKRERQSLPFGRDPDDGDPAQFTVARERGALIERTSGDGPASCASAVGPFGEFGCLARDTRRYFNQHPTKGTRR